MQRNVNKYVNLFNSDVSQAGTFSSFVVIECRDAGTSCYDAYRHSYDIRFRTTLVGINCRRSEHKGMKTFHSEQHKRILDFSASASEKHVPKLHMHLNSSPANKTCL